MSNWAIKYVGIPFDEDTFTCWTLVRRVLIDECHIDIEPFADISAWDSPRIQEIVAAEIERDDWRRVEPAGVRPFDVALMWVMRRLMGRDTAKTLSHIGIIAPGPCLLHVEVETHSVCPPLARVADRVDSFYRHRSLR